MYKIYPIFHKTLFRKCYEDIPEKKFREIFTCIAVNEDIVKNYDPWFEKSIIREYELPVYNPFLQKSRFCESSVLLHLVTNYEKLVDPYEFIGVFHYDMIFKKRAIDIIETVLNKDPFWKSTVFYYNKVNGHDQFGSTVINPQQKHECLEHAGWRKVLNEYNKFYGTSHEYLFIIYDDVILNHSFMLHKNLFKKIVPFVVHIIPQIIEMLGSSSRHLPFTLETLWGFMLLLQKREQNLRFIKLDIIHDEGMKDDEFLTNRNSYT